MNLNQVTVHSSNVEQSVVFYETLGLKLIVEAYPKYARLVCPVGRSTFSISYSEDQFKSSIKIYFEIENLDEKVELLKQAGIKFTSDPEDKSWLWREAHLLDPEGNNIVLYSAGNNRLSPPWRLPD